MEVWKCGSVEVWEYGSMGVIKLLYRVILVDEVFKVFDFIIDNANRIKPITPKLQSINCQ